MRLSCENKLYLTFRVVHNPGKPFQIPEQQVGPLITGKAPGKSYSYTSGALIPTPVGSMRGSYGFVTVDGHSFRAEIPEFALHTPDAVLH